MLHFKHSIKLVADRRKYKDGSQYVSLRLRLNICGHIKDFTLGVSVPVECFKDGKVVKHEMAAYYNTIIASSTTRLQKVIEHYEFVEEKIPTIEEIGARYSAEYDESASSSIWGYYDQFIEEQKVVNSWSNATIKKYKSIKAVMTTNYLNLTFAQINTDFLNKLVKLYVETQKYSNSTTHKYIVLFKTFLRWAENKGLYDMASIKEFKLKLKNGNQEIVYLTLEELKKLQELELDDTHKGLDKLRDVFLFCCYSGLRYSDVRALKKDQINDTYIHIRTQKTNDDLRIDLNTHTRDILNKYKDTKSKYALPVISNQKANEFLKELCAMAGITTPTKKITYYGNKREEHYIPKNDMITFHVARKTFITTAITLGISPEIVMKWSGHKDYDAMKPYVAIVDELKAQSMKKFDTI